MKNEADMRAGDSLQSLKVLREYYKSQIKMLL